MKQRLSVVAVAAIMSFLLGSPALASFHLWKINEIYSNADGTVQYIELFTTSNLQEFTSGLSIRALRGFDINIFVFPSDTPSPTGGHHLLLATAAFASLPGAVTPDFTLDDGFLFTPDGIVDFVGANSLTYDNLPTDGISSLHCDSNNGISCTVTSIDVNSPTNYAGETGAIDAGGSACMDADNDGFGSPGNANCPGGVEPDCDDTDDTVFPGATEIPDDGIDQDCNGFDTVTCFVDGDNDGFGSSVTVLSDDGDCTDVGESGNDSDCDDTNASINPGAAEICGDGVDNDCDELTDDVNCLSFGACCDDSDGFCSEDVLQADCESAGLRFGGDTSTCATIDSPCAGPGLLPPMEADPPFDIPKNRFVSINPNNDTAVSFKVELLDLACSVTGKKCNRTADCKACVGGNSNGNGCSISSDCPGGSCELSGETCDQQSAPVMLGWVGDPYEAGGDALPGTFAADVVAAQPAARVWAEPVVHIGDCEIAPVETYAISATTNGSVFSDRLVLGTIGQPQGKFWGDVVGSFDGESWSAPNVLVNVDDIVATINFLTLKAAPHVTVIDLVGGAPSFVNFDVNATDLLVVLQAFGGQAYPPPSFVAEGYPADGDVTQCP